MHPTAADRPEDDPELARLASGVLDGEYVDWTACPSAASDGVREELEVLAEVVHLHRSLHAADRQGHAPFPHLPWQAGNLTITECVGRGAFGAVFRAWDSQLERNVALKFLHDEDGGDDGRLEEGRLLAKVRHPNVVTVHGAERINDRVGLVTEFVDGRTLAEIVKCDGPFGFAETLSVALDLCRALTAVHQAGLLHGDVKPQNVMRQHDGRIVLMDFGAGHQSHEAAARAAGTPLFLAPEVLSGAAATAQSDIYSLGVLLHYLLTASYPVVGPTLLDIRRAHAAGRRTPLRQARPDLPGRFLAVIERALESDRRRRFSSADEMRRSLENVAAARHRRRAASAATALVLIGIGTWISGSPANPADSPVAFHERDVVLVAEFDNHTGEPQFDRSLHLAVADDLSNSRHLTLASRERIAEALQLMSKPESTPVDASTARAVARRDGGIRLVVSGRVEKAAGTYVLTVQIIDAASEAVLRTHQLQAETQAAVRSAVRALASWIRGQLGEPLPRIQESEQQLEAVRTPSLRALRLYSRAYDAGRRGRWAEAEELVRAALDIDPEFAGAQIWLAWCLYNTGRPRDEYLPAAERAFALAPTAIDRERYWIRGSYFTMTGRPEQAAPAYEALLQLQPDHMWGLGNLRATLTDLGRPPEQSEAITLRVAGLRPNSLYLQAQAAEEVLRSHGIERAKPYVERARRLVSTAVPSPGSHRTFVRLFPVHELWAAGRYAEASAALAESGSSSAVESDGDWAVSIRGSLHLALGQIARAEESFNLIRDSNHQQLMRARVALVRGDLPAVRRLLRSYGGPDLVVVSMLIRAQDVAAAERVFHRIGRLGGSQSTASEAELQVALNGSVRHREVLRARLMSWPHGSTVRRFHYSETLADHLVQAGAHRDAIKVLEAVSGTRESLYWTSGSNAWAWMRTQKRLADLYRLVNRGADARKIEADLLRMLEAADVDHPLRIELNRGGP
jgi:serine/threonine protein kinase/tetratricopeptide (TPR) repeat protein